MIKQIGVSGHASLMQNRKMIPSVKVIFHMMLAKYFYLFICNCFHTPMGVLFC